MSIMRTTVSIDDELLSAAREAARQRGITLGGVLEDALRRFLAPRVDEPPAPLPVFRGGGGLRPGIDPTSNRSLREAAEEGKSLDQMR
jgi:hypothetical protein